MDLLDRHLKMFLIWDLSAVFLMIRLAWWVLEGRPLRKVRFSSYYSECLLSTWLCPVDGDHLAEMSGLFMGKLLSPTSSFYTVFFGRKLLSSDHIALRRECLCKLFGIFLNGKLASFCRLSKSYFTIFFLCLWDRCEVVAGGDGVVERIGNNSHQFWVHRSG